MRETRRTTLPRGEFRALWVAEALSVLGDQLAKVSLSILIYQRTGSAAWSGLAYGLSMLPPLVTGPALSFLADRFPRRAVMVVCCLLQAACVLVLTVPSLPLAVLAVMVAAISGIQAPFKAAQGAVVLDILGRELNKAGRARLTLIREGGQLLGLAGAAGVIGLVGVPAALLADAVSFLVAAVLIRTGLRHRQAARTAHAADGERPGAPWRLLRTEPAIRPLVVFVLLIGITAVPDGVIVPLTAETGAPEWAVGPLLAADCLGLVVAARLVESLSPDRQRALIGPLAVLSVLPLAGFAAHPHPVVAGALLVLSGAGSAFLPLAFGEFLELVPPAITGSAGGLLNSGLRASQGLAAIAGGALGQALSSASFAVAGAGLFGLLAAGLCAMRWRRTLRTRQVG